MPSPQMGLVLPTPGTSVPDWANILNTAFSLIDTHDHTAGHGLQVPSAGISINADLSWNGFNLTQARTLRLQPQSAAPALASDAGCLYLTTGGDLWWNNGAGQHIQITAGAALSAASLGGISGLGGTSAGVAFSNSTKTFTFTQAANQSALLDAGPLVIHDTAASAFGITLQSPVGIAGAYALTLPTALPAANALLSIGTSGVLSAFGTVSGTGLTLAGTIAGPGFGGALTNSGSTPVAITPNAGWTTGQSPAYYKDACGRVHVKGILTWSTGASFTMFTLPAGFRPGDTRQFSMMDTTTNTLAIVRVTFVGDVSLLSPAPVNAHGYTLDGVSFLAEA